MKGMLSSGVESSPCRGEGSLSTLRVAVEYQDEVTLSWAQEAYRHLVQEVGEEAIRCTWWKGDHLAQGRVLNEAIREATRADMILVALRGSDPLHPGLKAWVDSWATCLADHPRTVVVFAGRSETEPSGQGSVEEYLRRAAVAGGLDYMVHEVQIPSPLFPEPRAREPHHDGEWPVPPPADGRSAEVGWGINE